MSNFVPVWPAEQKLLGINQILARNTSQRRSNALGPAALKTGVPRCFSCEWFTIFQRLYISELSCPAFCAIGRHT